MARRRTPIPNDQRDVIKELLVAGGSPEPDTLEIIEILRRRGNVVLYGPPGTGKTYRALQVRNHWEQTNGADSVFAVTFHPSYSYEDFVQGFRPKAEEPSEFELTDGILLGACERAQELADGSPDGQEPPKVLLLIDEINRGDVARIFGELITYIEFDKRGEPFFLSQDPQEARAIPPNVYFLGTMNTADKSISLLDVALRRRFAFVEFPPNGDAFVEVDGWADVVGDVQLGQLLEALNARLLVEGIEWDRSIGHALLSVDNDSDDAPRDLRQRLEFDIYPLVAEYCYLDPARLGRVLPGLVDLNGRFMAGLTNEELVQALVAIQEGPDRAPVEAEDLDGDAPEPAEEGSDANRRLSERDPVRRCPSPGEGRRSRERRGCDA
ncbi:MAG: McrB family protein [Vicinamibacteraceae bacterium]